jgi:signal transduction histidine kinase
MRTYRVWLFLIAALTVAGVLMAMLFLSGSSLARHEIGQLDARLCMEARRVAAPPRAGSDLGRLEVDIASKLLLPSPASLMFRGHYPGGALALRSRHWRDEIETRRLDWALPARQPRLAPSPDSPRTDREGRCSLAALSLNDAEWRVARYDASTGTGIVAADTAALKDDLWLALRDTLPRLIPLAVLLTLAGAWLIASVTMRPLNRLREAMKGLNQKGLDQRLDGSGEKREFAELIDAYNAMLDRLETSFLQASRFSADAAHELRTPLTLLRGRLEQALSQSDNRAIQGDLAEMQGDVDRLAAITRKLLLLSKADAGRLTLLLAPVDLSGMLAEMLADARMLAEDRRLESRLDDGLSTEGDAILLRQLFNNLISNALRYCPPGGWIRLEARAVEGGIEVLLGNASEAIDAEERRRFFDRFYRGRAARAQGKEGSGLGLGLAREIARAHGGDLILQDSAATEIRLRLWLPRR